MTVPPPIGVRAPRNVRPRVTLHANWRTRSFCPPWGVDRGCISGRFDLELRPARRSASARPDDRVAVDLRESSSGDVATVEIVPRGQALLEARTRFEILYTELDGKEPSRIVASFETGDTVDTTPPSWSGVTSHEQIGVAAPAPTPKPSSKVVTLDEVGCGGPGLRFLGPSPATDDQTRPEDMRYAIWMANASGSIDYLQPPLAIVRGSAEVHRAPAATTLAITFGGSPPPSDFSFPSGAGKRPVKVGIRAIDLAGNLSIASERMVP